MDISVSHTSQLPASGGETLRLGQLTRALRRNAPLIAGLAAVGVVGAYAYARTLPRTYTASTSIAVDGSGFAIPELQGALRNENAPDPMPFVRTEVQALTSPDLERQVIKQLSLDQNPEFNSALRPASLMDEVQGFIRGLLPSAPGGGAGSPDDYVLMAVQKATSVFQDNRSLVIGLSFTSEDPALSARFVNTLTQDYIDSRTAHRDQADRGANAAITQRITMVKAGLDHIEQQMQDLRSRGDIVALRAGSVGQQQVEELASAAAKASVDRSTLEATYNRAVALAKAGNSDALAGVLNSPTISRLRDQEADASAKLASLSSRYGSGYPAVRSAQADLSAIRSQLGGEISRIVTSMGAQLRAARDNEADIARQLSAARTVGVQAENANAQLGQLQKDETSQRALYQTLLERQQQTLAQPKDGAAPDVRVLNVAAPPGAPSGPHTKLIAGMGGIGGGVLGVLLALLRIRPVSGFADPAAATRETGLTVAATLRRAWLRRGLATRALSDGEEMRALQSLRARLRFAGRTEVPRVILFAAGPRGGDGGELAAAFARAAAAGGEAVLLIEADLATAPLPRILDMQGEGLLGVLRGEAGWRDAALADPHSDADVLLTGQRPAAATGLLRGVPLQNLLIEARRQYDLVVLSGPAVESADFPTLVSRADVTVVMLDGKASNAQTVDAVSRLGGQPNFCAVLVS